jgi:hypothetical protein
LFAITSKYNKTRLREKIEIIFKKWGIRGRLEGEKKEQRSRRVGIITFLYAEEEDLLWLRSEVKTFFNFFLHI